jgi:RNA polymerase sigma-70 factor, ECF subfamily
MEAYPPARDEAFEALMRSQERRVLRTALRILGRWEDAQDAAQEVFLRLYRFLDRIDASREIEPWLYRMTVNVCFDQLRKRRPVVAIDFDPPSPARQFEDVAAADRRRGLEAALLRLSDKERAAIVLRDIEGLETSEVAEILGSSESTVRSQISVARVKLRRLLEVKR